mgnify:CR=1 FL=1
MRKKLTGKRLIAVFLAVLMALTCFTALPFAASAATPATSAGGKYVFAYFTGDNTSEQKIRFAVSDDGYNFTAINGNQPVVEQTTGTSRGKRPYPLLPYSSSRPDHGTDTGHGHSRCR